MGEQYIQADDIEVPAWVESIKERMYPGTEVVWVRDIEAICEGGCSSGAYLPAVTYYQALRTMRDHGDEVLSYIWEQLGEVPGIDFATTYPAWSNIACHYLSLAVELWAHSVMCEIESADEANEEATS